MLLTYLVIQDPGIQKRRNKEYTVGKGIYIEERELLHLVISCSRKYQQKRKEGHTETHSRHKVSEDSTNLTLYQKTKLSATPQSPKTHLSFTTQCKNLMFSIMVLTFNKGSRRQVILFLKAELQRIGMPMSRFQKCFYPRL